MCRFKLCGRWIPCLVSLLVVMPAAGFDDRGEDAILRPYFAANGLLQRGLFDLAADEYRTFLKDHSDHEKAAVARYGLSVCLFRSGKQSDAVKELEKLDKIPDFAFAVDVLTMLGQCKMASGDFDAAARVLRRVLDDHGDHKLAVEAGTQLAEALFKSGKAAEACDVCKTVAQRWPDAPQIERIRLVSAMSEMDRSNYTPAVSHLESLIAKYPKSTGRIQAELLLAQCQHHLNHSDEAINQYREVLKSVDSPLRPEALYGLAALLLQKGDATESGRLVDELIEKYPGNPLIAAGHLLRGRAWFEAKSFEAAVASFELAAKAAPEAGDEPAYWIAKCELRGGKFKEAARRLKKALKAYSQSKLAAEMTYDRAMALGQSGDPDLAITELQGFLTGFSEHVLIPDAIDLLATLLHQAAKYEESEARCDEFIKRFPSHARAAAISFMAGENEFIRNRYAEAATRYKKFLDQFPKDEQADMARYRLGMSLLYEGKAEEAAPFLAEAEKLSGSDDRLRPALFALANASFDRGEWKKAEELFARYLVKSADPATDDDALLKLGLVQARQNRQDDAVKTFDQLLAGNGKSPHRLQAIFERGQSLLALKRNREAAEAFEQVLTDGRDSRFAPYARNHLAALALQGGDFKHAEELFAAVEHDAPTPELAAEAMYARGETLASAQSFKTAAETFGEFVSKYPDHDLAGAARVQQAIALSRDRQYKEALALFDKASIEKVEPELGYAATYEQAWCLREMGRTEEAVAAYRKLASATDAGSLRLHAMLELAAQDANAKKFVQAIELLTQLRNEVKKTDDEKMASLSEQAAYRLGICQFEASRFADAAETLAEFSRVFKTSTMLASAYYYAGAALCQLKKYERAVEHLDRAIIGKLDDALLPSAMLRIGEAQAQLQHWAKSEEAYEKYLHQFRDHDGWYQAEFGLGWSRENQGRHDEALKSYRAVIEKHKGPTAARAQFQIGECLFAKKQYEEAVRELLKVDILYDYPEWSAAALYEAGRCFEKLAKSAEARQQFKSVAEKFGDTQWARLASQRLSELSASALPGHTSG